MFDARIPIVAGLALVFASLACGDDDAGPTCPAARDCAGIVCGLDPVCATLCDSCPSGQTCNASSLTCAAGADADADADGDAEADGDADAEAEADADAEADAEADGDAEAEAEAEADADSGTGVRARFCHCLVTSAGADVNLTLHVDSVVFPPVATLHCSPCMSVPGGRVRLEAYRDSGTLLGGAWFDMPATASGEVSLYVTTTEFLGFDEGCSDSIACP